MSDAGPTLDAIRAAELEAAERVETARAEAKAALDAAGREAADTTSEGRRRGREQAQRHFEEVVAEAREEADAILAAGEQREAAMRSAAIAHIEEAVVSMIDLILTPPDEEDS